MKYRVVITETNIDEAARPEAFRYVLEGDTENEAINAARERFHAQTGREPAPRALIDVIPL